MNTDLLIGVVLRILPTIILVALSFVAVADKRTRDQWTNLLYQAGSLKPSQREDPRVQRGVRNPFLVVAFIFLIWPVRYYLHATAKVEVSANAYGNRDQAQIANTAPPTPVPTIPPTPTIEPPVVQGAAPNSVPAPVPQAPAPQAAPAPAPGNAPVPGAPPASGGPAAPGGFNPYGNR